MHADLERQEMMRDLHHQVKFIKDHHLNMQEEKEKQEAAKKAKEMKKMEQEAQLYRDEDYWIADFWTVRLGKIKSTIHLLQ